MAKDATDKIVKAAEKSHKNVDKIVDKSLKNVKTKADANEKVDGWLAQDEKEAMTKSPGMKLDELARKKGLLPETAEV